MTPDLTQITEETRRAYRHAGGDPKNAMWLWEYHNGHRRGVPNIAKAVGAKKPTPAMIQRRASPDPNGRKISEKSINSVTAYITSVGRASADDVVGNGDLARAQACKALLHLFKIGKLRRQQIPNSGGRYEYRITQLAPVAKSGFSAVVGAQTAARASTGQVCGVSGYRMEVIG